MDELFKDKKGTNKLISQYFRANRHTCIRAHAKETPVRLDPHYHRTGENYCSTASFSHGHRQKAGRELQTALDRRIMDNGIMNEWTLSEK